MTTPYSQLTPDQLHSALSERDDQLRVALGELEKEKESHIQDIYKLTRIGIQLHSSQERCKELEGEVEKLIRENTFNLKEIKSLQKRLDGQDLLIGDLKRESSVHKTVLKECVDAMNQTGQAVHTSVVKSAITHATEILENTEPQSK